MKPGHLAQSQEVIGPFPSRLCVSVPAQILLDSIGWSLNIWGKELNTMRTIGLSRFAESLEPFREFSEWIPYLVLLILAISFGYYVKLKDTGQGFRKVPARELGRIAGMSLSLPVLAALIQSYWAMWGFGYFDDPLLSHRPRPEWWLMLSAEVLITFPVFWFFAKVSPLWRWPTFLFFLIQWVGVADLIIPKTK